MVVSGVMTGCAQEVFGGIRVFKNSWLVGCVADSAILLNHFCRMWLVALGTVRDNSMFFSMAKGAGHFGMKTWVCNQLNILFCVTSETFGF